MTMDRERILDKIRKLMSLAKGSNFEEEVDSALKFARAMMEKHGIEEESVILDETADAASHRVVEEAAFTASTIPLYDVYLAWAVTKIAGCRWFYRNGYKKKTIQFYGFPADVGIARDLWRELRVISRTMMHVYCGKGASHSIEKDYLVGFCGRLKERADFIASRPATSDPTGMAIIVRKDGAIEKYKEGLGLKNARGGNTRIKNGAAYNAGMRDGSNVNLGTNGLASGGPGPRRLS